MAYAPYKYNPAEMPPDELAAMFVARHELLDHLVDMVRRQSDAGTVQHALLLGPRGIGKTTLLLMLQRAISADKELADRWMVVRYREEEFYVYTFRDLLALALENLCADADVPEAGVALAKAEAEADDRASLAVITSALKRIARDRGKRILLLIDNFDQVLRTFPKADEQDYFQRTFRKMLSTEAHLMVVGTSTLVFEEIAPYDQAFFNFFCPIQVENLSDEQIETLLLTRAKIDHNEAFRRGFDEHRPSVRAITYLTGGNPRLVLMLYEILSRREFLPVVQALRETVDNLTPMLKDVLESLPRQQSKILDAVMRLGIAASPSQIARRARLPLRTVTAQLTRLKETGMVRGEGEGKGRPATYLVRDQMFRTWYQMRYLRPARRRVEMFVEFARMWFSLQERTDFLSDLRTDFTTHTDSGRHHRTRELAVSMEYLAASFEDDDQRNEELAATADARLALGDMHEAAMILADVYAGDTDSQRRHEAAGYAALGRRLKEKGDVARAIEALRAAVERDGNSAEARVDLGYCYGVSGDHQKALREYTIVSEREDITVALRSEALNNRGVAKGELGDLEGEILDHSAVVGLAGAPVEEVAIALVGRGLTKGQLGDVEGGIADYGAVVALEGAPVAQVAEALNYRGVVKGKLGDAEGAITDCSMVVALEGASAAQVATALRNRGVAKSKLGDVEGAITDCSTVVALEGAPVAQVAMVLNNRGVAKGKLGDVEGAMADYNAVLAMEDAPPEEAARASYNRGTVREEELDVSGAVDDYTRCAESRASAEAVYRSVGRLVRLLARESRLPEAKSWMRRLGELEPDGTPWQDRVANRAAIVVEVARRCSVDVGEEILAAAIDAADEELRNQLKILKPALEFARTGDEAVVKRLPVEEQDLARKIAGQILEGHEEAQGENGD